MLFQRIVTAVLLLAVLLPAVFYPDPAGFFVVTMLLIAAGGWEWARLNACGGMRAVFAGAASAAACIGVWSAGALQAPHPVLWAGAGSLWVLGCAVLLRAGVPVWGRIPATVRCVGGVLALVVTWTAVAQARLQGVHFLFSVLALVWFADIFAYLFGRLFGNRVFASKLAPAISPGKTWEGALGGLLGVTALAAGSMWLDAHGHSDSAGIYTLMYQRGIAVLVLSIVFLTTMSVAGDLMESLFKRSAGVKDSSNLLPGHGGVLDRVDALLPVVPLAMMLVTA